MTATYEEQFGPVQRRMRRITRWLRWHRKGWLGQERHLLVELNWRLGDEIMALPVLDALHQKYPDASINVLTNYPDLFLDHPHVRAVTAPPAAVDRYVLLRGASRRMYRLAEYCARVRISLPSMRPVLRCSDWDLPPHLRVPEGDGPIVAFAPGASWKSKRWLSERWEALADILSGHGCRLLVLGQAGEGLSCGTDLTGQTNVLEAACVLHGADLLVCCDSGLMHLSLASGTPVVALFGPTDPEILIRGDDRFIALCSTKSCRSYWNHAETVGEPGVCPDGHECCLDTIAVEQVADAVLARLGVGDAR
ncbi:MAG: glycosyltransferase family 9 protein [Candidatus Hydrogenedentes bacterium]|nr:glycosyltransferase family 9 protein [Candidatus Hydrogenedentota bacterium]